MLNHLLNSTVGVLFGRIVREEVRMQGLKAVRGYVAALAKIRLGVMGLVGLISLVALLVAGIVLTIGAIVWMLPISAESRPWITLIAGLLLVALGTIVLAMLFSQKRWLELSRANDLMQAVIEPVPTATAVPKNMVRAFKGGPMEHSPRSSIEPRPEPTVDHAVPLRPRHV